MAGGKRKNEEPALGVVPIERERQRIIDLLSEHFAHDNITVEELERRMAAVYRASSLPALRQLTHDLPSVSEVVRPVSATPEVYTPEQDHIYAVMTETKRRGFWRPARHLSVWSIMSETNLDFTEAELPDGVTEIDLHGIMASVKIIVPPGVRVVNQVGSFMAEVTDENLQPPSVGSGAPVVRLTGFVFMAELKVHVRQRELLP